MVRHVPNALTVLRLLAVPVLVWLIATGRMSAAFWLFLAAGLTDAVDGAVARLCNARTALGAWLDPLADKALLVAAFVVLWAGGYLPLWLVVLVVLRDVLIVLYAVVYVLAGAFSAAPLFISKINTAAQIALAALVLAEAGPGWATATAVEAFVTVVAVTTTASGAAYLMAVGRKVPARDT
ncbi:CDP-alcohol phosphatidyltransferase family protein [Magnetospirillum sp. UT-4]|uniref:CDP-alcohol phosphatidyltransferase family protein n=1 Tax=Magnetospirillum sp. UT-4 TaxID=2681467 RepID=UPI001382C452|nr:CDP-alcohol phosphatidyltransferase family protein [Magnetospirillum sp. UT-4]CAA7627193.1 putative CDP-alcohol phosphatidyltransferase [Magnetospirillum sp. UT-4]